jgi:RNA polymerase sigma-70 factor (ECF subfamily)
MGSGVQLEPMMRTKTEASTQATITAQSSLLFLTQEPMDLEQNVIRAYETLRTPVYQYLAATFGDPVEAEDLAQETFLRLYVYWAGGKTIAGDRLRSWIFRVAHNLAIDRTRSTKFIQDLASEEYRAVVLQVPDGRRDPEETLLDRERFSAIRNGLALLSAQERRCLYLRAEGFCYREIAEILNITSSSVAEFLRRAMRKMAR